MRQGMPEVWSTRKSGLIVPGREIQIARRFDDLDYERWINRRRAPFQPPFKLPPKIAAVAFVQSAYAHNQGGGTSSDSSSITVTNGNVLGMLIQTQDATSTISSIVLKAGSTATIGTVTTGTDFQNNSESGFWAWCAVTGNGTCVLTITLSAGINHNMVVHEYSGADTTAARNTSAAQRFFMNNTGTDAVTSTAITPSVNGCAIMGMCSANNAAFSVGTNFTLRQNNQSTWGARSEDLIQGTAASIAGTWTNSPASNVNAAVSVLAISPASGAAAPTYPQLERFGHRGAFRGMLN